MKVHFRDKVKGERILRFFVKAIESVREGQEESDDTARLGRAEAYQGSMYAKPSILERKVLRHKEGVQFFLFRRKRFLWWRWFGPFVRIGIEPISADGLYEVVDIRLERAQKARSGYVYQRMRDDEPFPFGHLIQPVLEELVSEFYSQLDGLGSKRGGLS